MASMAGSYATPRGGGQPTEQPTKGDRVTYRNRKETLFASMKTERSTFDAHWREIADYFKPRRQRFWVTDRNKGQRRNERIIDNTGTMAWRALSSGLHAGLTSPARPWLRLTTPDPDLAEFPAVKDWLHTVTTRMLAVFIQTNLYNALPTVYGDCGGFGTSAMALLEDRHDLFRATAYPIGSYVLGLDDRGMVSIFGREFQMTVEQIVKRFVWREGERAPDWTRVTDRVKDSWDRGRYQDPIDVRWLIEPNDEVNPYALNATAFPYRSCYWEVASQTEQLLEESGFREFPILAPRWDITDNDNYGTDCPGMIALGDQKQLQTMERRKAQAIEKIVNPPMTGPTSLRTQQANILAGGITYVDVREGQQGFRAAHEINLRITELAEDEDRVRYRIKRAFHEDLFMMLQTMDQARDSGQPITAREVAERHEEKLLALGPTLERMSDECHDPLVDRTFAMMLRRGLLDDLPPPDEIQGVQLRVEYESVLAQAQKLVGISALDRFVGSMMPLTEAYPAVKHKLNPFVMVSEYQEATGVNPKLVRTDEEAQASADAEAQQQQALVQSEATKNAATAAHQLGTTPTGQDTALDKLMGALGQ